MDIDKLISSVDADIADYEKALNVLKDKKERFSTLKELHPNIKVEHGIFCLEDIWDKITCMRLERTWRVYNSTNIVAKFSIGKKAMVNNMKIHSYPLHNVIATINRKFRNNSEITIHDYVSIIGATCPKKDAFIKRIRLCLVDRIMADKLIITDNSYGKDALNKLLILR